MFTSADTSQPIWLDDVTCTGDELSLAECLHSNWGATNCKHKEDAGCMCEEADVSSTDTVTVTVADSSSGLSGSTASNSR